MNSQEQFIAVIKEKEGLIYKVTKLYAHNREDAQDLYQEIVYQLWKSFDSFRNESKRSTWLYRVALNTALTHVYKDKKRGYRVPVDAVLQHIMDEPDTMMQERVDVLYEQIKTLSTVEKGIILLYLEGKSYEEIAAITGFTATNVGTRLGRIKQKLQSQINK
jgi:RNA polymerase sigma factor (sigma-70 family)